MIRNLKALGLALVAIFAMGAVMATGASAQGSLNAGGETHVKFGLTGEQTGAVGANSLTAFGSTIECEVVHYEGHEAFSTPEVGTKNLLTDGATKVTVTPKYEKCKDTGTGKPATVNMTKCDYTLTIGAATEGGFGVDAHLECKNAGEEVHVEVFNDVAHKERLCTVTFAPQTPHSKMHVLNTGAEHIGLTGTYTGIVAKREGLCLLDGKGTNTSTGVLHIDATIEATDSEGEPLPVQVK